VFGDLNVRIGHQLGRLSAETEETLPLAELLAKAGDGDFLRSVAEAVVQLLMETDLEGLIGVGRHERSGDHTTAHSDEVGR
jgi:hypothetical protein